VLVLDEPTNHLDLDAREALEDALRAFEGSVLLVSHDRALLDAVGTRTIAVEHGTLRSYEGGWAEYRRVLEERRAAEQAPAPKRRSGNGRPRPSGPSKNAKRRQEQLEKAVEQAESRLAAVEDELADPSHWSTPERSAKAAARHAAAKKAVEDAYAAWETA
jgi:ATP-binding cassette, subfamily F, member 3